MPISSTDSVLVYLDTDLAMAQIGDMSAVLNILSMVEETLYNDIPRISQLLAGRDVLGAQRLLHSLKGFMPIFCRAALCEHVSRVDTLCKGGEGVEAGEAFALLQPELEQLLSEISTYMKSGHAQG